jgi:hypothetical protein
MKKLFYRSSILLLQAFFLLSPTISAEEVSKEIHKEFNADKGTTLGINNKYGDVVVESWTNNQIVIDVKITVELPDKTRAEKFLGYIDVQFTEGENIVNAETVIDDNFSFTGWVGDSRRFSIDYIVKMPVDANLNVENKYGDTDLDELNGLVNIIEKYGDINILKLTRGNVKPLNTVNISYGKVTVDESNWLDITARYCNMFEIQASKALLIDTRYSKFEIADVSSVVMDAKYDNLNIDNINNIVATSGYTTFSIGKLTKKLNIEAKYGKLSVDEIPAGFETIDIESDYCSVELGIDESASYYLDANARYGDIQYDEDNFKIDQRIFENTSKEVKGVSGTNANPLSKVNIRISYGSVSLY